MRRLLWKYAGIEIAEPKDIVRSGWKTYQARTGPWSAPVDWSISNVSSWLAARLARAAPAGRGCEAARAAKAAGNNDLAPSDRLTDVLLKIAQGRLSHFDETEAAQLFGNTRNPDRERRYEQNIRLIIEKAIQYLNSRDIPDQRVDQTFLDFFADYCQRASDPDTQDVWAQILAAKIQRPRGLSIRTLRMIQDINQDIAKKFVRFSSLVFKVDNDFVSIRLKDTDRYLKWAGLEYADLLELFEFGLVVLGLRTLQADAGSRFEYFGRSFQVTRKVEIRTNPLSAAGRELFGLADPIPSPSYFEEVIAMLRDAVGPLQGSSFRQNAG